MDEMFDVEAFLRTLRATKPPWECPKCGKIYKSFSGMEYHLQNFDHTFQQTPVHKPMTASRKSKLKFSKKKKNSRLNRRSPSPLDFTTSTRDTLTWAEAQRMVEVESEGKIYRLNISDKLDIISDSDIDKEDDSNGNDAASDKTDDENKSNATPKKKTDVEKNNLDTPSKASSAINSKDLKNVTLPKYESNAQPGLLNQPASPSKLPKPSFRLLPDYEKENVDAPERSSAYYRYIEKTAEDLEEEIEYDMDEEDAVWLELMNEHRSSEGLSLVTHNQLELLMDRFEKESYFEQARTGAGSQGTQAMIDEDAVCCVCNDGECQNSNVILFCDMCNLAVHQECYGVPYIPEGQWLCRRCLQSPSCPVDCCLCPSRSGAFKQTDDGRWSHVVCALWVPEVGFANTVFLEPIDGLKNIPAARWRLTCYVCKQRNVGACIQCHRANCYTAFHVTCAQQAGLYMKMEPVRESGRNGMTVTVKKEAYCDAHTPLDASPRQNRINGQLVSNFDEKRPNDKMKKARKMLAEKRHELPHIAIPYIPRDRMTSIGRHISIQKKSGFLQRLLSYWTLKRQSRNGVPLLRRLQSHVHPHRPQDPEAESQQHVLVEQLKYWHRLRHDLERARLLIELIRKREKLKRETIRISQVASELQLTPFVVLLRRVLNKLKSVDVAKVFAEPVKPKEAPDYHKVIKQPMDFSTMASKIENQKYKTLDDFETDFNLVINNCMQYNTRDTIFYRLAVKMRDHGGAVLRAARREIERVGFDFEAGMLLSKTPEKIAAQVIDEETRSKLSLQEQLDVVYERLDQAILNSRKTRKIRTEISALKRRIFQQNHKDLKRQSVQPQTEQKCSPNQIALLRRFSADDVDDISNTTESEAVISDVGASIKISPRVRPTTFSKKGLGGRKRLWSSRTSSSGSSVSEPKIKKGHLERSESCPVPNETKSENSALCKRLSCNSTNASFDDLADNKLITTDKQRRSSEISTASTPKSNQSSGQNSPASNNSGTSVSRRTAVLFRKKPKPQNPSHPGTDSLPDFNSSGTNGNLSETKRGSLCIDVGNGNVAHPTSVTRTRSVGGQITDIVRKRKLSSPDDGSVFKEALLNGFDCTSGDGPVFKDNITSRRRESFQAYREELPSTRSTSDSDTTSSAGSLGRKNEASNPTRKRKSPKKKRSRNSSVTSNRQSDATSEETSNDDRPGLILGENAGHAGHIRKQSYTSTTEDEMEEEDLPHMAPLDLVWAKCRGYPPYPALLIDPKMPRSGYCHNGVPIPVPPLDVLQVGNKQMENGNLRIYLVLFFDTKRTWQWLPRNKLEPLGKDQKSDQAKLVEGRRPSLRKNVVAAYKRALLHRSRVTGEIPDSDDDHPDNDVACESAIKE
ncbi:unnamed protein product [Clavelina lepadiformis]|uniref:Peregrin n=1 Tax=Clavelina lepadiformis TaxID=159417 RepID=A0ABP0GDY5_CLALP